MMSLTFGLFTQVSGSGPLGPLVLFQDLLVGSIRFLLVDRMAFRCSLNNSN